ncbi:hypothetical protein SAMN05428949_1343 [Chitinophaga sp. YR627]|uniref:exo-rhamnogalacturonan lyase family protein n=1 Tax=Chitinophaga sp. YR627 TaxID=1881041 RepID=UPI0008E49572|nr:Tat pathway signal sequence domain protein [Chitinophaga sp. YR627]SFM92661.1 hypothetical protein SAMN05428949_1343 [Chitinophaga sp. YR627]
MPKKISLSRRAFVKNAGLLTAGWPVISSLPAFTTQQYINNDTSIAALQWLGGAAPKISAGSTWGVPWPKGLVKKESGFVLSDNGGASVNMQSWPLATWPDGSVKWSAHAIGAGKGRNTDKLTLSLAKNSPVKGDLKVSDYPDHLLIDTGVIQCEIARSGPVVVRTLKRKAQLISSEGKLVLLTQDKPDEGNGVSPQQDVFESNITHVTLEQGGPVRAVVKIEGNHLNTKQRAWLPFTVRLYFYEGAESIRIMHTIVFDGDEQTDFIRGLGIRFALPLKAETYNRHIRFTGDEKGVFAEAVKGLTGLRRDPGAAVRSAQINGQAVSGPLPPAVGDRLQYIPAFGDYTLFQPTPDAFDIQKRTREGYGWIQSAYGKRSSGTAYLGTPSGGLAFGIRNFWQSHPAQLDIRNAHADEATVTMWFWAPKAAPMDLRFYHDGMGQDTFEKQREGLEITYEDYEPEFGTPYGVARTSEAQIWVLAATPTNEQLSEIAAYIQDPAGITFDIAQWKKAGVFGGSWIGQQTPSAEKENIRAQLDFYFDYYHRQVDDQHWYGFWNYGDVMHSYDTDRHVWRYDVGGFAWDNSELSTDLWLWYYYLHTGRKDVFRMAEAMTRHTGEVDVHHIGRFAPLGSRHNVQHWGCSAKQLRISTVANRRFYYYLTADERIGDLMHAEIDAADTLRTIVPGRKIGQQQGDPDGKYAGVSFGTDWGSLAAAWLTEWERSGNKTAKERLLNSMQTIAAQPNGFFTGSAAMELATGKFQIAPKDQFSVSHLSAVFGLPEIAAELIALIDMPAFEKAWLQYCTLYNATEEEQKTALGRSLGKLNLKQGHARLTAFAAIRKNDPQLAKRAWEEFLGGEAGIRKLSREVRALNGPLVLNTITEADNISTNAVAQWGLTAMALLDYVNEAYPHT